MKHTPGPWIVDNPMETSEFEHGIFQDFGGCGAIVYIAPVLEGNDMGKSFEEWDANANLIAAAPDMLEALEAIIAACNEPTPHPPKIIHIAESVIAKAKGN